MKINTLSACSHVNTFKDHLKKLPEKLLELFIHYVLYLQWWLNSICIGFRYSGPQWSCARSKARILSSLQQLHRDSCLDAEVGVIWDLMSSLPSLASDSPQKCRQLNSFLYFSDSSRTRIQSLSQLCSICEHLITFRFHIPLREK